jgi:hypothetical protein
MATATPGNQEVTNARSVEASASVGQDPLSVRAPTMPAFSLYYTLLYLATIIVVFSIFICFDQPWIWLNPKAAPFPPPGMTEGAIEICPSRTASLAHDPLNTGKKVFRFHWILLLGYTPSPALTQHSVHKPLSKHLLVEVCCYFEKVLDEGPRQKPIHLLLIEQHGTHNIVASLRVASPCT